VALHCSTVSTDTQTWKRKKTEILCMSQKDMKFQKFLKIVLLRFVSSRDHMLYSKLSYFQYAKYSFLDVLLQLSLNFNISYHMHHMLILPVFTLSHNLTYGNHEYTISWLIAFNPTYTCTKKNIYEDYYTIKNDNKYHYRRFRGVV